MTNVKNIISTSATVIATDAMFACVALFASTDFAQTSTVVSSRSFPKASSAKENLFAEPTSTSVNENFKWGGIETLDVPQTESRVKKEAVAAATVQKAADEAAAAQPAAAAASRSEQRAPVPQVDLDEMTDTGAELASFSLKFQSYPYVAGGNTPAGWGCSGFVRYVLSQFGISLPRTSGAQATVGTPAASLADTKSGDILANDTHTAIYIGNGQVMNAINPVQGMAVSDVSVFGGTGYSIRRVM